MEVDERMEFDEPKEKKGVSFTRAQAQLFHAQLRFLLLRTVSIAPSAHSTSHAHEKVWTSFPNSLFANAIDVNKDRDERMSKEMLPWRLNAKLLQDPTLTVVKNQEKKNNNELATTKTINEEDMKFTTNVEREAW